MPLALPALIPKPLPLGRLAHGVAEVVWALWACRLEGSMLLSSGLLNPGLDLLMLGLLRMCRRARTWRWRVAARPLRRVLRLPPRLPKQRSR